MNPVAEYLTGWPLDSAKGRDSAEIFRIVDETTRTAIHSPVERVLRGGSTIDVASRAVGSKLRWNVTTLGQSVPLSHAAALEWAVSFAASRGVPVVYHRDDSLETRYAAAPSARPSAAVSNPAK